MINTISMANARTQNQRIPAAGKNDLQQVPAKTQELATVPTHMMLAQTKKIGFGGNENNNKKRISDMYVKSDIDYKVRNDVCNLLRSDNKYHKEAVELLSNDELIDVAQRRQEAIEYNEWIAKELTPRIEAAVRIDDYAYLGLMKELEEDPRYQRKQENINHYLDEAVMAKKQKLKNQEAKPAIPRKTEQKPTIEEKSKPAISSTTEAKPLTIEERIGNLEKSMKGIEEGFAKFMDDIAPVIKKLGNDSIK